MAQRVFIYSKEGLDRIANPTVIDYDDVTRSGPCVALTNDNRLVAYTSLVVVPDDMSVVEVLIKSGFKVGDVVGYADANASWFVMGSVGNIDPSMRDYALQARQIYAGGVESIKVDPRIGPTSRFSA